MKYKIVPGSQSCHCCFDFTVVDTSRPVMIRGEQYNGQFEPVCECFGEEDAKLICDALNASVANKPDEERPAGRNS